MCWISAEPASPGKRDAFSIARLGVTPDNFPLGTIITVEMNPLRNGKTFGAMPNGTPLVNCGMEMPAGGCNAETGEAFLRQTPQ